MKTRERRRLTHIKPAASGWSRIDAWLFGASFDWVRKQLDIKGLISKSRKMPPGGKWRERLSILVKWVSFTLSNFESHSNCGSEYFEIIFRSLVGVMTKQIQIKLFQYFLFFSLILVLFSFSDFVPYRMKSSFIVWTVFIFCSNCCDECIYSGKDSTLSESKMKIKSR